MPAECQPRRLFRERLQRFFGFFGGDRGRAAAAVVIDQPGQTVGPGRAAEVPGRVRRHDRAAERVAAEHDFAAQRFGRFDHDVQVFDRDVHAPFAGKADARFGNGIEVVFDSRVHDPAQVVVEDFFGAGLAELALVEHRLILEQVLAAFDRPHLPAWDVFDQPLGERHEVRRGRRGSRLEHQHVRGRLGAHLDHPDLVEIQVPCRGSVKAFRRSRRRRRGHEDPLHAHFVRMGAGVRRQHRKHQPQRDRHRDAPSGRSRAVLIPLSSCRLVPLRFCSRSDRHTAR